MGLLLLDVRGFELVHGVEEVRRMFYIAFILKLRINRQNVIQTVHGVVLEGLLAGARLILDQFLLEDGVA